MTFLRFQQEKYSKYKQVAAGDDLYEMLGVDSDSTMLEI
jgi:hypothetical protein